MPKPSSAKDHWSRVATGTVMGAFGALSIGTLCYNAADAARKQDIFELLAIFIVGAWFGFITWSAVKYAFTGYYPLAFVRLWNAMWGWLVPPLPLPPPRQRKL